MPLTVDRYRVLLAPDPAANPVEAEVAVIHGDRLRAELEAPRQGITDMAALPMHMISVWLWAACLRSKVIPETGFQAFANEMLLNFEEVEDTDGVDGQPADPMGPTSEGTDSPSSSPASSETSPAGSTPTPIPGS